MREREREREGNDVGVLEEGDLNEPATRGAQTSV